MTRISHPRKQLQCGQLKARGLSRLRSKLYNHPMAKHFLAGCALHKLEGRRLREWIEYHLLVGFEHLYLFDNNDQDDGSSHVVQPYVEQGKVTTYQVRGMYPNMQVELYGWLACQRPSVWLALFDLDEFILPIRCDDVRVVLEEFDGYAALAMNWRCFGTAGHVAAPQFITGSCTRASHSEWDNNRNVKSIIRPERILALLSSHRGAAIPGFSIVNER